MRLRSDNDQAARLVMSVLKIDIRGTPFAGLVIETDNGGVCGAVVFNDFSNGNIEMTGVGQGCWTPYVIRELARYVFKYLDCTRVTARTAVSNHKARAALRALGFRQEGRVREWFKGEDAILYGLLRREQRIYR